MKKGSYMRISRKTRICIEAAVAIGIVLSLITPGTAVIVSEKSAINDIDPLWIGKIRREIKEVKTWSGEKLFPSLTTGDDIPISGWAEGDDRRPSITKDSHGNTVVAYQHDEDLFVSAAGFAYNPNPTDAEAWWENGVILSLTGIEMINYPDTAACAHPDYDLMSVFISVDTEAVGGIYIPDVTDYNTWEPYTWVGDALEPEIAQIADGGWYTDKYFPEVVGPFNFYIYHEIYDVYDIPSCPICFHTGIDAGSGVGYFDAQSQEQTAPAADPDMVNLEDRFHTVIYNTETSKIIWKKIVPTEESDYEYTPYQATVADGTNPSIAAYGTNVAIVYMDNGKVKCVYSSDDGDTWSAPVIIADGTYPDIYAYGTVLYATYINNGNLYKVISQDGGATWSAPEQINDVDGTVVEEENSVDLHEGGVVWVDDRDGYYHIYYDKLLSVPQPNIVIESISGGIGVSAVLKNIGDASGTFDWSITLDGFVLLGKSASGTATLDPGETITVKSGFPLGFGNVDITVTADKATEATSGKLLLFYIII